MLHLRKRFLRGSRDKPVMEAVLSRGSRTEHALPERLGTLRLMLLTRMLTYSMYTSLNTSGELSQALSMFCWMFCCRMCSSRRCWYSGLISSKGMPCPACCGGLRQAYSDISLLGSTGSGGVHALAWIHASFPAQDGSQTMPLLRDA